MTAVWISACLIALFAIPLTAQAPVPAALKQARAAYLVNEAGDLKRLDELARELQRWKRWTLVDRRDEADVIVTLRVVATGDAAVIPVAGILVAANDEVFSIDIRSRAPDEPLWQDRDGSVRTLVRRLRERVSAAAPK